jgi:hypothetical protein
MVGHARMVAWGCWGHRRRSELTSAEHLEAVDGLLQFCTWKGV